MPVDALIKRGWLAAAQAAKKSLIKNIREMEKLAAAQAAKKSLVNRRGFSLWLAAAQAAKKRR